MSLLIKGVDMPKKCFSCEMYGPMKGCCGLTDGRFEHPLKKRRTDCPLVEIPTPHGRLIDSDRLIAVMKSTTAISQNNYDLFNHIVGLIEHQPTVIEKEHTTYEQ